MATNPKHKIYANNNWRFLVKIARTSNSKMACIIQWIIRPVNKTPNISHAFDATGSQFDENGNLSSVPDASTAAFVEKIEKEMEMYRKLYYID